ncbi:MAG TPA: SDR family oxidoreductase [Gemmatimonadales bacterium]|nr:SDR family oxidoreductase [Gemmatimonadales bacterium]
MAAKRILVLGATGGTGQEVVAQALDQGHVVTAFARHPERMKRAHERLRFVVGDVADGGDALADAVRGQDAVISALGRGLSLKAEGLIARGMPNIVGAMERQGVSRFIFTSAYGVGVTWRDLPLLSRLFARLLLRDLYADKKAGEEVLRRSALDWTIVYPTTLTNGPGTGRYRVGERLVLSGLPRISRADLAAFLLTQIEDRRYIGKGVLISG